MGNIALINEVLHHKVKVVNSEDHITGLGDKVANKIAGFVGSMWTFVGVSAFIVAWLFAGNIVGFDKTPWPLLLVLLNLPQLSLMISLQVSSNLAQKVANAQSVHSAVAVSHIATQVDAIADAVLAKQDVNKL